MLSNGSIKPSPQFDSSKIQLDVSNLPMFDIEYVFLKIRMKAAGSKIEVKSDAIAKKTGNVFVEYQSRGKKSGIATTESDYYAFEIDNTYIIISTEKLSKASRKYIGTDRDVLGGDSNTSKGILLPVIELV